MEVCEVKFDLGPVKGECRQREISGSSKLLKIKAKIWDGRMHNERDQSDTILHTDSSYKVRLVGIYYIHSIYSKVRLNKMTWQISASDLTQAYYMDILEKKTLKTGAKSRKNSRKISKDLNKC